MTLLLLFFALPLLPQQPENIDRLLIEMQMRGVKVATEPPRPAPSEETLALIEFDKAYVKFVRRLQGCPGSGAGPCRPEVGSFDVKLWNKVCSRAEKVFNKKKR